MYKSDRIFKMWSYSVSHSTLLLRSTNDEEDETKALQEGYNIDIEFSGVRYLDLPATFNSIIIQELTENITERFDNYSKNLGYKFFEIISDRKYFVIASNCTIGKNNWLNEDRLINPNLEYDEILALS
jgi:hypothetical protein